jgi:glycosyltransferase involved in cell wall biosynthesis
MKVLVLAPSMARAGGIQRYTSTLVTALKELLGDKNVHCVAAPEFPHAGSGHAWFSFWLKLRLGSLLLGEAARWRSDLVICTHLALGPVGWLLARLGRQPYWVVVHGIEAWAQASRMEARRPVSSQSRNRHQRLQSRASRETAPHRRKTHLETALRVG